jgi:hypothetical protein
VVKLLVWADFIIAFGSRVEKRRLGILLRSPSPGQASRKLRSRVGVPGEIVCRPCRLVGKPQASSARYRIPRTLEVIYEDRPP